MQALAIDSFGSRLRRTEALRTERLGGSLIYDHVTTKAPFQFDDNEPPVLTRV